MIEHTPMEDRQDESGHNSKSSGVRLRRFMSDLTITALSFREVPSVTTFRFISVECLCFQVLGPQLGTFALCGSTCISEGF